MPVTDQAQQTRLRSGIATGISKEKSPKSGARKSTKPNIIEIKQMLANLRYAICNPNAHTSCAPMASAVCSGGASRPGH